MEVALPIGMEQFARQQQRLLKACEVGWNEPDVVGMGLAGSFADGKQYPVTVRFRGEAQTGTPNGKSEFRVPKSEDSK